MLIMVFFRRSLQFALPKRHKQVQHVKESIETLPIPQPTEKGNVDIILSELNVFFTKLLLITKYYMKLT